MWGDRLLDDEAMGYGEWESARNGTHPAIERIPRDILICDWHYELRESYPSVPFFQAQGFRVLPGGWRNEQAVAALIEDARPAPGGDDARLPEHHLGRGQAGQAGGVGADPGRGGEIALIYPGCYPSRL